MGADIAIRLRMKTEGEAETKGLTEEVKNLSGELTKMQAVAGKAEAFREAQTRQKEYREAIQNTRKTMKELEASMGEGEKATAATRTEYMQATRTLEGLERKYETSDKVLARLKSRQQEYKEEVQQARTVVKTLETAMGDGNTATEASRLEYTMAVRSLDQLEKKYDKTSTEIVNFQDQQKDLGITIRESRRVVKELETGMNENGAATARTRAEYHQAVRSLEGLETQYVQNGEKLGRLRKELRGAGVDTSKVRMEEARLKEGMDQTRSTLHLQTDMLKAYQTLGLRSHRDIHAEVTRLNQAYKILSASGQLSSSEMLKAQQALQRQTARLREETNGWAKALSLTQTGMVGMATAVYAANKSLGVYSDYTQRMAEVNTLLDVSAEKHQALSDEILNLSRIVPQTGSELAAAQYDILSAGVALEDSMSVLKLSAKAAVAGVTDTKTAVNVGVGVINAYGMSIDALGGVYDTLFQTVKLGVTTFPELASSIGAALPTAVAAGVSFEDLSAAIVTLTKAGIRTPQALTAIKGAINAMAAPTPEAKKKFEELGITWEGLLPTLDAIWQKGLGLEQMRFLIPDEEARTGVLALTQNHEGLMKSLGGVKQKLDAMDGAFDKMKDTPENQIKLFRNELDKLNIEIGGLLAQAALPLAQKFRDLSVNIETLPGPMQAFLGITALLTGGFLAWHMGIRQVVQGLHGMALVAQETTLRLKGQNAAAREAAIANGQAATAMTGAATAGRALGVAMAGVGMAYDVVKIYEAVQAFLEMREAMGEADDAQSRMLKGAAELKARYAEFADVKIPGNLLELPRQELEDLHGKLAKARAYNTALLNELSVKAQETTWYGTATEEALAAQEALKELHKKQENVIQALTDTRKAMDGAVEGSREYAAQVSRERESHQKALDVLEKRMQALDTHYKTALESVKKYVEQGFYTEAEGETRTLELQKEMLKKKTALLEDRLREVQALADQEIATAGRVSDTTIKMEEETRKAKTKAVREYEALVRREAEETLNHLMKQQDTEAAHRDALYKKTLAEISLQEARGVLPHAEAIKKKMEAEDAFARWRLEKAERVLTAMAEVYGRESEEYKRALNDRLAAEAGLMEVQSRAVAGQQEINKAAREGTEAAKEGAEAAKEGAKATKEASKAVDGLAISLGNSQHPLQLLISDLKEFKAKITDLGTQTLGDVTSSFDLVAEKAREMNRLFHETGETGFGRLEVWVKSFSHELRDMERQFEALNGMLGTFGVQMDMGNMTLEQGAAVAVEMVGVLRKYREELDRTDRTLEEITGTARVWLDAVASGSEDTAVRSENAMQQALKGFAAARDGVAELTEKIRELESMAWVDADSLRQATEDAVSMMEEIYAAGKKTVDDLIADWERLAGEIEAIESQILSIQESTQEKIRELRRKTMDDEAAWQDRRLEYEETFDAAVRAMAEGRAEQAAELFKQAETLASSLSAEVKNQQGEVVSSLEQNTRTAIELMQQASDGATGALLQQQEGLKNHQGQVADAVRATRQELVSLGETMEVLNSAFPPLAGMHTWDNATLETFLKFADNAALLKHRSLTSQTQKFSDGGLIGGRPHSAGGTIIEAEKDEYIINRRDALRHGFAFLNLLNSGGIPVWATEALVKRQWSGPAFAAEGGRVLAAQMARMPRLPAWEPPKMALGGRVEAAVSPSPSPAPDRIVRFEFPGGESAVGMFDMDNERRLVEALGRARRRAL